MTFTSNIKSVLLQEFKTSEFIKMNILIRKFRKKKLLRTQVGTGKHVQTTVRTVEQYIKKLIKFSNKSLAVTLYLYS